MGSKSVLGHKLLCHLASKPTLDAPPDIDSSELLRFENAVVRKFSAFTGEIGALGIELRTDGDVFSRGHRHCARDEAGDTRGQRFILRGRSGSDA